MHAVRPRFNHGEAVMTRVQMEKVRCERPQRVVAEPETKKVMIERQHSIDSLDVHHEMAHPERSSAKSGNGAPRLKAIRRNLRTVEGFEHVPSRIVKANPVSDSPLIGEGALKTLNADTGSPEARGQEIERPTIGPFTSD